MEDVPSRHEISRISARACFYVYIYRSVGLKLPVTEWVEVSRRKLRQEQYAARGSLKAGK